MNNKARELLTNEGSDNDFSIDPELSSTQAFKHGEIQGLGSDHVMVLG